MGNPFEDNVPSRASLILLGVLLGANLLYFLLAAAGSDSDPASAAAGSAAADNAATASAAASGKTLTLIAELEEAELTGMVRVPSDGDDRPLPQALIPESTMPLVCRSWGPFPSTDALTLARVALEGVVESVEIRAGELESAPDYLVYLESDNNPDNARRILQELESQSIDAYVIAGGAFVNSVSAGVFSNKARADGQMQRLRDLGYKPRIEALERVQTVQYLIARVPEGFALEGMDSTPCPAIASAR